MAQLIYQMNVEQVLAPLTRVVRLFGLTNCVSRALFCSQGGGFAAHTQHVNVRTTRQPDAICHMIEPISIRALFKFS